MLQKRQKHRILRSFRKKPTLAASHRTGLGQKMAPLRALEPIKNDGETDLVR
jgi:hypothetical protein